MHEIFALAKQPDLVLASGHVSVPEIDAFLAGARGAGVKKLLISSSPTLWKHSRARLSRSTISTASSPPAR
jgi:hypothetical protein